MKRLALFLTLLSGSALAASPDLCRPYAAQFTESLMKFIWQRAYHTCLNEDEVPALPQDWYNAMCIALPDCQFAPNSQVPVIIETVPVKKHWKKRRRH